MDYLPAESNTGMFGGNSNWRGPVWMPVNAMIIRALLQFYLYYGDNFKVECPTGSGRMMNLFEVAKEIADRLTGYFSATSMAGVRFTAARRSSSPIPIGATKSCSTVLPRRQRCRARCKPSDRMDRSRGQIHPTLRPPGSQAAPGGGKEAAFLRVPRKPRRVT